MDQMNKQMNVDDIADLKDELADQMAEIEERQEFFAEAAQEDKEGLMEELDELEALAMEDEMNEVVVNNAPIAGAHQNKEPAQPVQEEEEKEQFAALAGMM